jgi:type II secretory pathway pseudopilin PulG
MNLPINIVIGLVILASLIILGILIAVLSFRISEVKKLVSGLEQRISRLEVITNLTESRRSKRPGEEL